MYFYRTLLVFTWNHCDTD